MAKQIKLKDANGKIYTLEYTRKSVEALERQGFVIGDVRTKPMITIPMLFAGAFLAHHKFVKQDVIDGLYKSLSNKEGLIAALTEMYHEPFLALLEDDEDDTTKKAEWTVEG